MYQLYSCAPLSSLLRGVHACGDRVKAVTRTAVVALLAMGVFWTAARLHAEPLLACMVAGVIVINRKCARQPFRILTAPCHKGCNIPLYVLETPEKALVFLACEPLAAE